MDLFLAICQGLGLALAAGLSGLLAPLFASVLAHVDVGWKLDGTSWDFVASEWFIAVLFALNVAGYLLKPVTFTDFVDVMAALNHYWTLVEFP